MQCVILAGGRGTRMAAFTDKLPKALIPVAGKPFIDHQLRHLSKKGVTDILLSVGYQGNQIEDFVKDGEPWGLRVNYVDEGKDLRGTGGALRLALKKRRLEPAFLLTYGDSYLPVNISTVWEHFQGRSEPILMTVFKNDHRWGASNVVFDGHRVTLYDKQPAVPNAQMHYLDYGLSGLRREWVERTIPEGASDLADFYKAASERGEIAGLEMKTRFYEVGSPEGLKDLTDYLEARTKRGEK